MRNFKVPFLAYQRIESLRLKKKLLHFCTDFVHRKHAPCYICRMCKIAVNLTKTWLKKPLHTLQGRNELLEQIPTNNEKSTFALLVYTTYLSVTIHITALLHVAWSRHVPLSVHDDVALFEWRRKWRWMDTKSFIKSYSLAWRVNQFGKLIDRIPGSRLLISSLPGSATRTVVESLGKPRDSTNVLEALPSKLDALSIFYVYCGTAKAVS